MIKNYNESPPKTEVELKRLQEAFLSDRSNKEIRDKFFILLKVYARSIALKEIKRKGIFLQPDYVDGIATEATVLLISQYDKEGWSVNASFAGVLYYKVIEALYKNSKEDITSSLNTIIGSNTGSNQKELQDILETLGGEAPWDKNRVARSEDLDPTKIVLDQMNTSVDIANELLDEAYNILPYHLYLLFLCWFLLQIRRDKIRNATKNFEDTINIQSKEQDAFNILLLEFRNRISAQMN